MRFEEASSLDDAAGNIFRGFRVPLVESSAIGQCHRKGKGEIAVRKKPKEEYLYYEWSKDGIRELGSTPYENLTLGELSWSLTKSILRLFWEIFKWVLRLLWRIIVIVSIVALYVLAIVGAFVEASRIAEEATKRNL